MDTGHFQNSTCETFKEEFHNRGVHISLPQSETQVAHLIAPVQFILR